jgi:hypothetical protein
MPEKGHTAAARAEVVHCGGCNPHIDRVAVADGLPLNDPDVPAGASVRLSGCPRACASGHRLTSAGAFATTAETAAGQAPVVVVVAGELVDGVPTPAAAIAEAVTRKLKE